MADKNKSAVAVGGSAANFTLFNNPNVFTLPGQVVSTGGANDASTDNQYIAVIAH